MSENSSNRKPVREDAGLTAREDARLTAREDARPPLDGARREGEGPREPLPQHRPREPFPQRRKPASGVFISFAQPTIVFVTVCTDKRRPWLSQPAVHDALRGVWRDARAWLVGRYVLMPDHAHFFCAPNDMEIPLDRWMSYWKRIFKQHAHDPHWKWQARHWDTRLRREENYAEKWEYVIQNPVRAGLVVHAEDWPFQGELNELRW